MKPTTKQAKQARAFKGSPLIDALYAEAKRRGDAIPVLAQKLGFSNSYFSSIAGGTRPVSAFDDDALGRCADYLDVPRIRVLVLAERLPAEDFISRESIDSQIARAFDLIRADKDWRITLPSADEWVPLPSHIKALIILLYLAIIGESIADVAAGKETDKGVVMSVPPLPAITDEGCEEEWTDEQEWTDLPRSKKVMIILTLLKESADIFFGNVIEEKKTNVDIVFSLMRKDPHWSAKTPNEAELAGTSLMQKIEMIVPIIRESLDTEEEAKTEGQGG